MQCPLSIRHSPQEHAVCTTRYFHAEAPSGEHGSSAHRKVNPGAPRCSPATPTGSARGWTQLLIPRFHQHHFLLTALSYSTQLRILENQKRGKKGQSKEAVRTTVPLVTQENGCTRLAMVLLHYVLKVVPICLDKASWFTDLFPNLTAYKTTLCVSTPYHGKHR